MMLKDIINKKIKTKNIIIQYEKLEINEIAWNNKIIAYLLYKNLIILSINQSVIIV